MDWSLERLQNARIAPLEATYEVTPAEGLYTNEYIEKVKLSHPDIFKFKAISVGDSGGQAFLVPLDESGRGTAELILKALKAYKQQ